jgi:hypothetical protein
MWDYPKQFATLSRRLRVEQETFLNTMELILTGCVGGKTLQQLLTEPGGKSWEESEVEQELRRILRGSYLVFMETVISMNQALTTFKERLRLGPDGKVCSC